MKRKIRITESDLVKMVRDTIKEQDNSMNPMKYIDEMYNNLKSGFCKAHQLETPRVKVICNNGESYIIQKYRKFGS